MCNINWIVLQEIGLTTQQYPKLSQLLHMI